VSLDHLHVWESISPAPQIIPLALLGCLTYKKKKKLPLLISNLISSDLERWSTEARKSNKTTYLGFWLLIKIEDLKLWWLIYGNFLNN
jgi:hypothetical protein